MDFESKNIKHMNLIISKIKKLCHISIVKENMGQGDKRDF
jgi:hypothetical protein